MNVHAADASICIIVREIERLYSLTIVGLLPRGSAVHVTESNAIDLLAKKRLGLTLLEVAQAEADLSERLGRPVGIVLTSEVRGEEAARLSEAARPL